MAAAKHKTLGEALRSTREELSKTKEGFSLRKVAEEVGISPSYLSRLEKGEYTAPSENILRNLAWYLKLEFAELSALGDGIPDELALLIRKQPNEVKELLDNIGAIPKKKRREYHAEMNDVALEYSPKELTFQSLRSDIDNRLAFPFPQSLKPDQREIASGGVAVATALLERNGFSVRPHPEFPKSSNALLAKKDALLPNKRLNLTIFPKTSGMTRQIRLGSEDFVIQRQESRGEEVYFGIIPKNGNDTVFEAFDLFIIPAKVAANDGLLAHNLYLSRGKKGIGVVIKDVKREPHKAIMDRWKRCFLYPDAVDWLPR